MITHTFENLSDEAMPLKNLAYKVVSSGRINKGSFNIIFFGSNGSIAKVGTDETMKTFCKDAYDVLSTSELRFFNDGGKGWYLYDDADNKNYPMDDYPIAPGRGFNISVSGPADGVQVTSSGAVPEKDLKVVVPDASYHMFGNAMPTEIKLEDITYKVVSSGRINKGSFNIIFFGSNGSIAKVGTDETMKTFCKDAYDNLASSELRFFNDGGKGWYLYDDADGKAYPMDKYPIAAGRGFNISVSGPADGVEVTIPSPLQDAAAAE